MVQSAHEVGAEEARFEHVVVHELTEDIVLVAQHMLREVSAEEGKQFEDFDEAVREVLMSYEWPGNVRELQNAVRRLVVLQPPGRITVEALKSCLAEQGGRTPAAAPEAPRAPATEAPTQRKRQSLSEIEKDAILAAIEECGGSIPRAAALLGVNPSTLYRKRSAWESEEPAK